MLRLNLRRKAEDVRQLDRAVAHDGRHRHAMDVAAGRNIRSIEVGVGVEPHQPDFLSVAPKAFGHARYGADRNGVIAAEHEGRPAILVNL